MQQSESFNCSLASGVSRPGEGSATASAAVPQWGAGPVTSKFQRSGFGYGVNSCLAAVRASKAQFSSRHPTNSRQQTPTARRQRVGRRSWPCGEPLRGWHAGADGCFHARPTTAQQSASAGPWASARGVSLAWPASSLHGPPPGNQHLSPLASQPLAA